MARSSAIVAVLAASTVARADVKPAKAAKLSLDVPATWKVTVTDDTMKGESKDKDIALLVWTIDSADVPAAEKKLEGELYRAVASLKWGKATTGKVHGLPVTYFDGIGHVVGGDVDVKAQLVGPTKTKKVLLVVAAVAHAKVEAHTAEVKALFDSVQPSK